MRTCILAAGLSLFLLPSHAQLTRGFLSGTVQDATGAVVDSVAITITHTATGIKRSTVTNEAGIYRFVAVEPGTYTAEFSKAGFESRRVAPIEISTTQEVVLNQLLGLATVTTTVEVVETPPGVELAKSTPTIGRKLDSSLVELLPTTSFARDVTRLALLAPGVVRATGSNEFSANGQRARNNNFIVDGVDNNDVSVSLPAARIIPEMVGEFQVQTASYSAEFGRNTGGQVSVTTKAGTNALHGEAFDYHAANWMEPLSLPEKRGGVTEKPRYVQNQAGGALGGPVIRDRTFFFALIETNRRREAPSANNATVINIPTPEGYAALARVPLNTGQTGQSRQAVLGALGFLPEIHSQISQYASVTNVNVNGTPIAVGSARIPLPNPHDFWYGASRVDHQLTSRDSLSYRSQVDRRNQPDVTSNLGFGSRWSAAQSILGQSHAMSHTRTLS
ncbi:MAG: carboxypeptidase regulatory-like domain-containing protein, partial [Bryobacteraceae bacterium]